MTSPARLVRQIFAAAWLLMTITPGTTQSADVPVIEIEVGDTMRFAPSVINARPGERVRVVIKGVGKVPKASMAHTFVLLRPGTNPRSFVDQASRAHDADFVPPAVKDQLIAASPLVGPGEAVEVTFDAPTKPGEYTFVCTYPSHFKLGMKGQLIVK